MRHRSSFDRRSGAEDYRDYSPRGHRPWPTEPRSLEEDEDERRERRLERDRQQYEDEASYDRERYWDRAEDRRRPFDRLEEWQQPWQLSRRRREGRFSGESPERGWEERRGAARSYAGIGPRDYQRSDERLREDVCDRLTDHPRIDASEIRVAVRDGEVTLEGSVPERRMKHMAEDCAESVSGVQDVHNQLRTSARGRFRS